MHLGVCKIPCDGYNMQLDRSRKIGANAFAYPYLPLHTPKIGGMYVCFFSAYRDGLIPSPASTVERSLFLEMSIGVE